MFYEEGADGEIKESASLLDRWIPATRYVLQMFAPQESLDSIFGMGERECASDREN